jgi:hypothetical protein
VKPVAICPVIEGGVASSVRLTTASSSIADPAAVPD